MFNKLVLLLFLVVVVPASAEVVTMEKHGNLQIVLPPGWQLKSEKIKSSGYTLTITSTTSTNSNCLISILFPPMPMSLNKAGIEEKFKASCSRFVPDSVEGKIDLKEFKLAEGYGVYASFTDASLVGKPIQAGDYKVMTTGLLILNEKIMAIATVFTNDANGPEQKLLLKTVSSMKLDHAKSDQAKR